MEFVGGELINTYYALNGECYQESDLEFLPDTEEISLEGWIARDKMGNTLSLYGEKPTIRKKDYWQTGFGYPLPKESFPSVTWDSEPLKVRLTITPME